MKDDYTYGDMGHNEKREGDKTNGQYYVVLPDGRRQVVSYYVDGYFGYVVDVKYEGEANAYAYKPAYKAAAYPAPAYKPEYWALPKDEKCSKQMHTIIMCWT